MAYKVFISSNMVEFKEEREAIVSTIENDDFLNDFLKFLSLKIFLLLDNHQMILGEKMF